MQYEKQRAVKKPNSKERKRNRTMLRESLLSSVSETGSAHEGGKQETAEKKKVKAAEQALELMNEVDRIEVVKDLGFSRTMVPLVFAYVFFLDVLINVDHGAVPAALADISEDLGMDQTAMGVMGSMVFFGLFVGSISASFILYYVQHKTIIWLSLCLNGASLWLFTATSNFGFMCLSRVLTGFSQIFITIYIPIYIDAYATQKQKSFLLSWVLVMPPIGVVVGYAMTSAIVLSGGLWQSDESHFWFQSFRLQCYISFASAGLVFLVPRKYLNINEVTQLKREYIDQQKSAPSSDQGIKHPGESGGTGSKMNMLQPHQQSSGETGVIVNLNKSNSEESNEDFAPARVFDMEDSENPDSPLRSPAPRSPAPELAQKKNQFTQMSNKEQLLYLWRNKPYFYLTMAITVLFFVISGVQMWATYYFQNSMGVPPGQAILCFAIVAMTSPVSGAIISGYIIDWLGGFYSPLALPFCVSIGVFGTISAWIVPMCNNYVYCIVFLWILLFIGAIVLPICTGVAFTKVEPEMRPRANSLANLSYNLIGYFPAPTVYGFAVYVHGKKNSGWGMATLMYLSTLMVIFVFIAWVVDPKTDFKKLFNSKSEVDDDLEESRGTEQTKEGENNVDKAQDLQNSQMLTLNIGLGIADTFAKNEIFDNASNKPNAVSVKDNTEKIDLIDHDDLNNRIRQSQRGLGRSRGQSYKSRSSSLADLELMASRVQATAASEDKQNSEGERPMIKPQLMNSRSNEKEQIVQQL